MQPWLVIDVFYGCFIRTTKKLEREKNVRYVSGIAEEIFDMLTLEFPLESKLYLREYLKKPLKLVGETHSEIG